MTTSIEAPLINVKLLSEEVSDLVGLIVYHQQLISIFEQQTSRDRLTSSVNKMMTQLEQIIPNRAQRYRVIQGRRQDFLNIILTTYLAWDEKISDIITHEELIKYEIDRKTRIHMEKRINTVKRSWSLTVPKEEDRTKILEEKRNLLKSFLGNGLQKVVDIIGDKKASSMDEIKQLLEGELGDKIRDALFRQD